MTDSPICEWSGLMRLSCPPECPDHGNGWSAATEAEKTVMANALDGHPVTTIGTLETITGRRLDAYRVLRRAEGPWKLDRIPDDIGCPDSHGKPPGMQLCHACHNLLDGLLADTPELIAELATARRRSVKFVPGGSDDTAGIPWSEAASRCHRELTALWANLANLDQPTQLTQLGHLHRQGRRIIDRPRDLINLGNCPICGHEIRQERPTVTELEQATATVRCVHAPIGEPACPYTADWHDHQRALLDQRNDMMLTVSELVGVLTEAGEPATRRRIKYLVEHHGLPRERITRPHLRGRAIVTEQVWVHRLGDVRDLIDKLNAA